MELYLSGKKINNKIDNLYFNEIDRRKELAVLSDHDISKQLENYKVKTINFENSDIKQISGLYIDYEDKIKLYVDLNKHNTKIKEILEANIPYLGKNFGALIPSKNIIVNLEPLEFISGLNLLHGFSAFQNYNSNLDDLIKKYVTQHVNNVIAFQEDSGIYCNNQKIKNIGESDLEMFFKSSKRNLKIDKYLSLI